MQGDREQPHGAERAPARDTKPAENSAMSNCPLRAILDRVIVRPDPPPERIGLIHLPEETQAEAKGQIRSGTVVAIGPGAVRDMRCERCDGKGCDHCRGIGHVPGHFRATELRPGDRVEIAKYGEGRAAMEFRHDGIDYLVMREDEVMGKHE